MGRHRRIQNDRHQASPAGSPTVHSRPSSKRMIGEDDRNFSGHQSQQHGGGKPTSAMGVNEVPLFGTATATGFHGHTQGPSEEREVLGGFSQEPATFTQVQRWLSSQFKTPVDHNRMTENPIRIASVAKHRENTPVILCGTHQVQH